MRYMLWSQYRLHWLRRAESFHRRQYLLYKVSDDRLPTCFLQDPVPFLKWFGLLCLNRLLVRISSGGFHTEPYMRSIFHPVRFGIPLFQDSWRSFLKGLVHWLRRRNRVLPVRLLRLKCVLMFSSWCILKLLFYQFIKFAMACLQGTYQCSMNRMNNIKRKIISDSLC